MHSQGLQGPEEASSSRTGVVDSYVTMWVLGTKPGLLCAREYPQRQEEGVGSPEAEVHGVCEPPGVSAGNRTLVPYRAVSM